MGTVRPSRRPSGQPPGRAPQDGVNLWWHKEKILMLRRRPRAFLGRRLEARRPAIQRQSFPRSEEHTSELQSLMRISYAVFCLKKKKEYKTNTPHHTHKFIT